MEAAIRRKRRSQYPDVAAASSLCGFSVLGCEVGGHFHPECRRVLKVLVNSRAMWGDAQAELVAHAVFHRRLAGLLSIGLLKAVMSVYCTQVCPPLVAGPSLEEWYEGAYDPPSW